MDEQSDSCEPQQCDPQPAGKMRKGFKLFGKRKPGSGMGSIFTRSKVEGNKSPIASKKTLDGLTETAAQGSEQEPEKKREPEREVSHTEEQADEEAEEPFGYDGAPSRVPPRPSISSITSAKSLGFLSLLRGGRRRGGDRRVHTVSQPATRQHRGLKSLFGSVRWRQREKAVKDEAPPSPLLMSSRTNSVEIIKEDLTLTPRPPPRFLGSPEPEPETSASAPTKSPTTPDNSGSAERTPSQPASPSVGGLNLHVPTTILPPPVPTHAPPLDPTVDRLSSLLADISSLISLDSLTGCGDIIADVEAEWGKSSNAGGGAGTGTGSGSNVAKPEQKPSSTMYPSTLLPITELSPSSTPTPNLRATSATVPAPVPVPTPTTKPHQPSVPSTYISPASKPALPSFAVTKPSPIITSFDKPTPVVTLCPSLVTSSQPSNIKPTPASTLTTKPAAFPTFTISSQSMSSPSTKSSLALVSMSTITSPPLNSVSVTPSISPSLTSITTTSMPSPVASTPIAAIFKPSPVAPIFAASAQQAPVTHRPTSPATFSSFTVSSQLDSKATSVIQTTSYTAAVQNVRASKSTHTPNTVPVSVPIPVPAPVLVLAPVSVRAPVPVPDPVTAPIIAPAPVRAPVPVPVPAPVLVPAPVPVSVPVPSSVQTLSATLSKTPPCPAPTTTPVAAPKMPFAPTPTLDFSSNKTPSTQTTDSISLTMTPSAHTPTPVILSETPPAHVPTPAPVPVSKALPNPTPILVSSTKTAPSPAPPTTYETSSTPSPAPVLGKPIFSAPVKGTAGDIFGDGAEDTASSNGMANRGGCRTISAKSEDLHQAPQNDTQSVYNTEKKTPQVTKATGLSKIPVVGGGRPGKLPVRETQPTDDEGCELQTPEWEEERLSLSQQQMGSRDRMSDTSTDMEISPPLAAKPIPADSHQSRPSKMVPNIPRDSKIPIKQGVPSYSASASQIPIPKEPHRTKIPVSKVPVRRVGNKATATSPRPVTEHLRK